MVKNNSFTLMNFHTIYILWNLYETFFLFVHLLKTLVNFIIIKNLECPDFHVLYFNSGVHLLFLNKILKLSKKISHQNQKQFSYQIHCKMLHLNL